MAKNNKLKQKRIVNEDMTKVRNMFILLIIVVGIVIGLYFLTEYMLNKDSVKETKTETVIDYDIATVGTMFNRIEDEYYVLIYSSKDNGSDLDSVLTTYRSSDNYIKTYYIDLDKKINSSILGEELNTKPNNSSEVKVNGPTLYRIVNGTVTNCYSGIDDIIGVLE